MARKKSKNKPESANKAKAEAEALDREKQNTAVEKSTEPAKQKKKEKAKGKLREEKSKEKSKVKLEKGLSKKSEKPGKSAKSDDAKKETKELQASATSIASTADKFLCYQKSVQCPEHDVDFFEQAYREAYNKKPKTLREDFCGTFAVCCEWVKRKKDRTAVGVDLCGETLDWGRKHNLSKLKPKEKARVKLLQQDVRLKNLPSVDVVAAQNFSFWIFKTRAEVVTYLRAARENLSEKGIMVLDMMGGGDCYLEDNVDSKIIGKGKKKFNYHWKQVSFNPVMNNGKFAISFSFQDESRIENAFEYDWRFWTIPEVREMLEEAGFSSSVVYFEREGDDNIWEIHDVAPSNAVWLAYIVAKR